MGAYSPEELLDESLTSGLPGRLPTTVALGQGFVICPHSQGQPTP